MISMDMCVVFVKDGLDSSPKLVVLLDEWGNFG